MEDAKSTYSMDINLPVNVECSPSQGDVVGFWQWIVTSNDGESSVLSTHTICRYGNYS